VLFVCNIRLPLTPIPDPENFLQQPGKSEGWGYQQVDRNNGLRGKQYDK
jgi:hypothetical protein